MIPNYPMISASFDSTQLPKMVEENVALKSMMCFISTQRRVFINFVCFGDIFCQGFIYNLQHPELITVYTYTDDTLSAYYSNFLYAITQSGTCFLVDVPLTLLQGLEIWTSRTSEFGNDQVYPSPCLVGMQPFIGPQKIAVSSEYSLLLSKYP